MNLCRLRRFLSRRWAVSATAILFVVESCTGCEAGPAVFTDPQNNCNSGVPNSSLVVFSNSSANVDTSEFNGDISTQNSGNNKMVIAISGRRKFIAIVPVLNGAYDLSSIYLSCTESIFEDVNVWEAGSGSLTFFPCDNGGSSINASGDMQPFHPGNTNKASGNFHFLLTARLGP